LDVRAAIATMIVSSDDGAATATTIASNDAELGAIATSLGAGSKKRKTQEQLLSPPLSLCMQCPLTFAAPVCPGINEPV
jgi:hypothetical protein